MCKKINHNFFFFYLNLHFLGYKKQKLSTLVTLKLLLQLLAMLTMLCNTNLAAHLAFFSFLRWGTVYLLSRVDLSFPKSCKLKLTAIPSGRPKYTLCTADEK